MPVPGHCCCDTPTPNLCFEVCRHHPTQIEITITSSGLFDVEGFCYTDNDDGDALSDCDDVHDAAYSATIDALDAADPPLSDEDYCAAQYSALETDLAARKTCIDTHTEPWTICPCGAINGATIILDFMPDDSIPWTYCAYRGILPVEYHSIYGQPNCSNSPITDNYFQFWAYWFPYYDTDIDPDFPIGGFIQVVCPWGPTSPHASYYGNPYLDGAGYISKAIWCNGSEPTDLVHIDFYGDETTPVYADEVLYVTRKDTPYVGYVGTVCGQTNKLNAFANTQSCNRPYGGTWSEFAAAPYPDTYGENLHYPINVVDFVSLGGSL